MSWLNKAKNMLYETGTTQPPAPQPAQPTTQAQSPASGITTAPVANQEMVDAMRKVVAGRNSALTRLMQSADTLIEVIPDPVIRLRAAHKMVAAGQTGTQIAAAIDIHLGDIATEVQRFEQAANGRKAAEQGSLNATIATCGATIESAQNELQKAQERIAVLTAQVAEMNARGAAAQAELAVVSAKYDASIADFKSAAAIVSQELEANRAAIISTIK